MSAAPQLTAGGIQGAWSYGWCTRAGLRHSLLDMLNEDSVATCLPAGGGFHGAVADGVSGSDRGKIASSVCVNYLSGLEVAYPPAAGTDDMAYIGAEQRLDEQVRHADVRVQEQVWQQAPGCTGATTFSACWLDANGRGWLTRCGDCRVYHWSASQAMPALKLPLADQSFAALSETPPHPDIPLENPARMCGNGHLGYPELVPVSLEAGDGLVLTSDGVHGLLSHAFLSQLLARGTRRGLTNQALAQNIERHAFRLGGADDLSVLVVRFCPENGHDQPLPSKPAPTRLTD